MLRRRIALLCPVLLLSVSLACEKPPATDTTTPTDATPVETTDAPPADAPLPPAEEVLSKSVEALGGRAAIDAVKSSYSESKTEIKAQGINLVSRTWTKGRDFYIESDMPGVGLSQVWKKGDEIWSKDPINGLRKLEGKEADQARWASDPLLVANWKQYFDEAKTVARTKDGERELYEVELGSASGDELVLSFDAKTSLPAGQAFKQSTPMGDIAIRITLDDYRDVQGVMVPFRSVTAVPLMSMVQTTEKYEVNVEVDDAKLQPPSPDATPAEPEAEPAKGKGKGKTKAKAKPKSTKAEPKAEAGPKAEAEPKAEAGPKAEAEP
jgi:hypothetical protein